MTDFDDELDHISEAYWLVVEQYNEAKVRIKELEAWYSETWMKGVPEINLNVLIKHELGAGDNYDVACYLGKNDKGEDRFMMSHGTEIFRKHVTRWRAI